MNLLNGKIKNIYFKYLAAAFGSALITSIYTIVAVSYTHLDNNLITAIQEPLFLQSSGLWVIE